MNTLITRTLSTQPPLPHCRKNYRNKVIRRVCAAKDGQVVMCSRVKEPKVAVFPRDFAPMFFSATSVTDAATDTIVDGSAFYVPGKVVTGEYFCINVKSDKTEALGEALKMQMFKSVLKRTWNVIDPIYYVAVVQPDNDDFVYVHDLEGIECYLASYADGHFTFRRAVFGPGLLEELKEVLQ